MSGSDDSIDYVPEEGPNQTPGPVSPNADLMTSQPTNFSSSISNTSVDGSNASESVNESLTSEPDMVPALSFVDEIGRRRIRDRVRSRARSRSGAHSNAELAGLRTVPASTNLIPRDDSEVARPQGNRRPWSAPRTRFGLPASSTRLPFPYDAPVRGSGYWMSRTRTGSPASSTSGSEALSPLPPHIAEYARELRGNGDVPPFQAATIAFNVSQMVIDMEARLPMTPERRRRIRRHRRAQDRARAQAQDVLSEVIDISPSSSGNDSERRPEGRPERQPPRNVPAQVRRRGNSVSDCSQCSSDEEPNDKKSNPDPLEEWLYPV